MLRLASLLSLCASWASGCGGTSHDHGGACAQETRAESYRAGMEKTGKQGALVFRLLESQPGPPQKGDNTWTLSIQNSGAAPLPGATVTVTPFMPDHGHGSPIRAEVSELAMPAGGGQYRVFPINLFMPGLWQITVAAQASGVSDSAVFALCIEG
jgi:hypothetical protein